MSYVIPPSPTIIVADHDPAKKGREGLPIQYRVNINPELPQLNYVASGQPNVSELAALVNDLRNRGIITSPADLFVIDLRGEEHCFLNGEAVAYAEHSQQQDLVDYLKINNSVYFKPHEKFKGEATKVAIESVIDEASVVKSVGGTYERLNVQDHSVPENEDIDKFIELIRARNANPELSKKVLYIHCHGGKGRTSQFVAMLVLLQLHMLGQLPPDANLLDVLKKNLDESSYAKLTKNLERTSGKSKGNESPTMDEDSAPDKVIARINFLNDFLNYVVDKEGFSSQKSWSAWSADHQQLSF